jgi:hypothetical protein
MVSMIAWTRTTLKSGFRFRTNPALGVWASEISDLPIMGYPLELLRGPILVWGHHKDEADVLCGVPTGVDPDLEVIIK